MEEKSLLIMENIMNGVEQTKEWTHIQLHDPGIMAAQNRWKQALESAKAYIPKAVYNSLSDAQSGEVAAYSSAAILYGMRVAIAIHDITRSPELLSQHIIDRTSV